MFKRVENNVVFNSSSNTLHDNGTFTISLTLESAFHERFVYLLFDSVAFGKNQFSYRIFYKKIKVHV